MTTPTNNSDESLGYIIAIVAVIGGGWWLYNTYEIRERTEDAPAVEPALPMRPVGLIDLVSLENGTVWRIDADAVSGPRNARQAWVSADHSKNASVVNRETKTLYRIDCDKQSYRVLSVVEYDKDGAVTGDWGEDRFGDEEDYAPPRTNISSVIASACSSVFDPLTPPPAK